MAIKLKSDAEIRPILSPKFNKPTASDPKITVKLSHDKKVLSLAKKTLGSTLVGKAILLPGAFCKRGAEDIVHSHLDSIVYKMFTFLFCQVQNDYSKRGLVDLLNSK